MKDMSNASYVIGIKIHKVKHRGIIRLCQVTYIIKFDRKKNAPLIIIIIKRVPHF